MQGLSIPGYKKDALVADLILNLPGAGKTTDKKKANFVDLNALGDIEFEASLADKRGSSIRRNRRLYEPAHGNLELVRAENIEEAMRFFSELAVLHNARWRKKEAGRIILQHSGYRFSSSLDKRPLAAWRSGLSMRACQRKSVRFSIQLHDRKQKFTFFRVGLPMRTVSTQPGVSLCIEEYRVNGYSEFDLLAGESQYKSALARHERFLY